MTSESPPYPYSFVLPRKLVSSILGRSGIWFESQNSSGGISFRASDFDRNKGFVIEVVETHNRLLIAFGLEIAAADLARSMRLELAGNEAVLYSSLGSLLDENELVLRLNGAPLADLNEASAEQNWFNVEIEGWVEKPYLDEAVTKKIEGLLAAILLMLPTEDKNETIENTLFEAEVEGAVKHGSITRYERSAKNRRICLALFGFDCKICGVDLERRYGPVAKDFIHVHHVVPVSRMSAPSVVNPAEDLIPVCPNCHYVMHREDPPVAPEVLRRRFNEPPGAPNSE